MSYDCTPNTNQYPENGNILKAAVEADPSAYTLEDNGNCECCPQFPPCSIADDIEGVDLCMVIEGDAVPCSAGNYVIPYIGGKEWGYVQVPWEDSEGNCITGEGAFAYGLNCVNIVGEDQWSISVGGSFTDCTFTLIQYSATPFMLKYLAKKSCLVDIPAGNPDTFTVTFTALIPGCTCPPDLEDPACYPPPPPPPPWWCVEIATYPFRDCVQNVTEAVGGPYVSESACNADVNCLPCNYYCLKIQEYSGSNPVGNPYWECQALTDVTVGEIIIDGNLHKLVFDGPFTSSKCICPPCSSGNTNATPDCNTPTNEDISSITIYGCLDGVCVAIVPGTEADYPQLYFEDTCNGECV